jgi:hypothetical protein
MPVSTIKSLELFISSANAIHWNIYSILYTRYNVEVLAQILKHKGIKWKNGDDVPLISSYRLILSRRVVVICFVYLGISVGSMVHAQ